MNRHYLKAKLFNHSGHNLRIYAENIWELPPYVIAELGGEISKVMLNAAEHYIFEKCFAKQKHIFGNSAFPDKNNS